MRLKEYVNDQNYHIQGGNNAEETCQTPWQKLNVTIW